jgi:hypothetical protein
LNLGDTGTATTITLHVTSEFYGFNECSTGLVSLDYDNVTFSPHAQSKDLPKKYNAIIYFSGPHILIWLTEHDSNFFSNFNPKRLEQTEMVVGPNFDKTQSFIMSICCATLIFDRGQTVA